MSGSLSSVVSNLVRASVGSSVPNSVQDDDVDRYVAELILKEAKQKAAKYGTEGIRAYLPVAESNAPRTNKRFLSSIIRSTDDHNKTILRAQALAAQEVRMEREEEERRERKARAEEAVAAERLRRMMGRTSSGWEMNWDHGRERERERSRRKRERSVDDDEYEEERSRHDNRKRRRHHSHHHHRHRSRSFDRGRRTRDVERRSRSPERRSRDDSDYEKSRRRGKHRSRSPTRANNEERKCSDRGVDERRTRSSLRRSSESIERSKSPLSLSGKRINQSPSSHSDGDCEESTRAKRSKHRQTDEYEAELRSKLKAKSLSSSSQPPRTHSPTPDLEIKLSQFSPKDSASSQTTIGPATPSPPPNLPSKMDKYFTETYDPRLDVAPLTVPTIPATGLISDAEFEGWDAMLELIRLRREDKEEKKRLERMGISTKDVKGKKTSTSAVVEKWDSSGGTGSIMDIEYKKRGSVREWDMGKEGF